MSTERVFYAWVEVREWGEEPREKRIGPFHAESEDEVRDALEAERDETVLRIKEVRFEGSR